DSKKRSIEILVEKENKYLREHVRAKEATSFKRITGRIKKLGVDGWVNVKAEDRKLTIYVNDDALAKEMELDGCYIIKTDLSAVECDTQTVHDRYKDLALV